MQRADIGTFTRLKQRSLWSPQAQRLQRDGVRKAGGAGWHWALPLLALLGSACALPEYKLLVSSIPPSSTELDAQVYLPSASKQPVTHASATFAAGTTSRSITIDLKSGFESPERAVFGVITRDAAGCITASHNTTPQIPSSVVADVVVPLVPVRYPKAAAQLCRKITPVVVDVEREEVGYFPQAEYHLLVSGWGFSPTDRVTIKSQMQINSDLCKTDCAKRCPDRVMPCTMSGVSGAACQTGCSIEGQSLYVGPGLLSVLIPDQLGVTEKHSFPTPDLDISFTQLRGYPMTVTVTRSDGTQVSTFVEQSPTP